MRDPRFTLHAGCLLLAAVGVVAPALRAQAPQQPPPPALRSATRATVLRAAAPLDVVRALREARMHVHTGHWNAARRVLTALRQALSLEPDPVRRALRVRVEFVLWDLRLGLIAEARRDLDALFSSVSGSP